MPRVSFFICLLPSMITRRQLAGDSLEASQCLCNCEHTMTYTVAQCLSLSYLVERLMTLEYIYRQSTTMPAFMSRKLFYVEQVAVQGLLAERRSRESVANGGAFFG